MKKNTNFFTKFIISTISLFIGLSVLVSCGPGVENSFSDNATDTNRAANRRSVPLVNKNIEPVRSINNPTAVTGGKVEGTIIDSGVSQSDSAHDLQSNDNTKNVVKLDINGDKKVDVVVQVDQNTTTTERGVFTSANQDSTTIEEFKEGQVQSIENANTFILKNINIANNTIDIKTFIDENFEHFVSPKVIVDFSFSLKPDNFQSSILKLMGTYKKNTVIEGHKVDDHYIFNIDDVNSITSKPIDSGDLSFYYYVKKDAYETKPGLIRDITGELRIKLSDKVNLNFDPVVYEFNEKLFLRTANNVHLLASSSLNDDTRRFFEGFEKSYIKTHEVIGGISKVKLNFGSNIGSEANPRRTSFCLSGYLIDTTMADPVYQSEPCSGSGDLPNWFSKFQSNIKLVSNSNNGKWEFLFQESFQASSHQNSDDLEHFFLSIYNGSETPRLNLVSDRKFSVIESAEIKHEQEIETPNPVVSNSTNVSNQKKCDGKSLIIGDHIVDFSLPMNKSICASYKFLMGTLAVPEEILSKAAAQTVKNAIWKQYYEIALDHEEVPNDKMYRRSDLDKGKGTNYIKKISNFVSYITEFEEALNFTNANKDKMFDNNWTYGEASILPFFVSLYETRFFSYDDGPLQVGADREVGIMQIMLGTVVEMIERLAETNLIFNAENLSFNMNYSSMISKVQDANQASYGGLHTFRRGDPRAYLKVASMIGLNVFLDKIKKNNDADMLMGAYGYNAGESRSNKSSFKAKVRGWEDNYGKDSEFIDAKFLIFFGQNMIGNTYPIKLLAHMIPLFADSNSSNSDCTNNPGCPIEFSELTIIERIAPQYYIDTEGSVLVNGKQISPTEVLGRNFGVRIIDTNI